MSTPVARTTNSTVAAAIAHVLGCEFLRLQNIYTPEKPFRTSDVPGELVYHLRPASSQFKVFDSESGERRNLRLSEILDAAEDRDNAAQLLISAIQSIEDSEVRQAAITALPASLAGWMAVFADVLVKMMDRWRDVPPERLIVRRGSKTSATSDGKRVTEDSTERLVVPLKPGPKISKEWKVS